MAGRQAESAKIVDRARRVGWAVVENGNGWKIACPDGTNITVHKTYGDVKSFQNVTSSLERKGLAEAEADLDVRRAQERREAIQADRLKAEAKAAEIAQRSAAKRATALTRAAGPYASAQPTISELLAKHAAPRTYQHVLVDAAMAKAMLDRNDPRNRALKPAWVAEWVQVIRAGKWLYTHQGVAFNTDALIQDGQHRLTAVVETEIPVEFQVSVGMPDENFKVLDSGHGRTAGSVLSMEGFTNGTTLAAMGRVLHLYETWGPALLEHTGGRVSNSAIVSMVDSLLRSDAEEALALAHRLRREIGGGVGGTSAAFYLLLGAIPRTDPRPMAFIEDLIRGVTDDEDPVYWVRRTLTRAAGRVARRLNTAEQMTLIIKGWNARVKGHKGSFIVVRTGSAVPAIALPE